MTRIFFISTPMLLLTSGKTSCSCELNSLGVQIIYLDYLYSYNISFEFLSTRSIYYIK